jgi:hypothetical protein
MTARPIQSNILRQFILNFLLGGRAKQQRRKHEKNNEALQGGSPNGVAPTRLGPRAKTLK